MSGNLAAMYFRKRLPGVEVVVIGRPDRERPLVGESTVELTTHFLKGLGLSQLLEERHYHKYLYRDAADTSADAGSATSG